MTSKVSKTSLNGVLAFLIAVVPLAQQYPDLHLSPVIFGWLSFGAGLARLYVGLQQQDADRVLAQLPGQPVPEPVPAHPVPDDPKAKVVVDPPAKP